MRLFRRSAIAVIAVSLLAAASAWGLSSSLLHVMDLQGRAVERVAPANARVVVLIFAATDCPISKRYVPEIARLERELAVRGVAFWWVYPNSGDTVAVVQKHGIDFSIRTATLIDSQQELVRMAHVTVTPEAAVFVVEPGRLREVYHGRIDDRYAAFGRERPRASSHDLEAAIRAVLAGQPVVKASGGPVGCSIVPMSEQP